MANQTTETSPKYTLTKVHLMLTNHQIATIDEIVAAIRRNTGSVLNRSAVVRAIVEPVIACGGIS